MTTKTKRDYYEVLNVLKTATTDEIKKSYRKLALKYHPDRNQGDQKSEEKFKEASEAYSVLGNEEKRQIYDQYGFECLRANGRNGFSDFSSFFSDSIFSDFEDILGNFFGFGSFSRTDQRNRPTKGNNIGKEISLSLEEAYKGIEKNIEIEKGKNCFVCNGNGSKPGKKPEACHQCDGKGKVIRNQVFFSISTKCPECKGSGEVIKHPCRECSGKGRIEEKKTIKVTFPAGVDTGNRLRVSEEGEEGYNGGGPGDLFLIINVEQDREFKRKDSDLIHELCITFSQAALGDEVKIKTFYGTEKIRILPETQSRKIIRLKGKGFMNLNGWARGDLLVTVKVISPTRLSNKEMEIFKKLQEIEIRKGNTAYTEKEASIN